MPIYTSKGTVLMQLKDGGVFESCMPIYVSSTNSYIMEGSSRKIFKTTKATYDNVISLLYSDEYAVGTTYDVRDYTLDKINAKSEKVLAELKRIFPSDTYVILDNNVFISMVWSTDDNGRTSRNALVIYLNRFNYSSTSVSSTVIKGYAPIRFTTTSTTGNGTSKQSTGELWWIGGYYDFSKHENKANIVQQTNIIFEDSTVGSSFYNYNSFRIYAGSSVVDYNSTRGYVQPYDTSLGLTSDYFRELMYSPEDTAGNVAWGYLSTYLGNPSADITTDNRGGNSGTGGGDGDYDDSSDEIPIPGFPDKSATDTSMVSILKPSSSQLDAFSNKMWSDWWEGIAKSTLFYGDPADIVINLSLVPVEVASGGTIADLKVAGAPTGLEMTKAAYQYVEVDCGSIDIKEYWGSFMDYEPFTKIELVLPYCGSIRLDTDEVMNSKLSIVYHVDLLTGNCIAFIHSKRGNLNSVIAQLNGNVSYNIPITGDNFSKLTSTLLGIATGGISTVAQNGAASTVASNAPNSSPKGSNVSSRYTAEMNANAFNSSRSIATSANAVADVMSTKPSVTRSGDFSSNNGIFAIQYPYLIITRPKQSVPKSYPSHYGHLSNITETLSNLSGYTVIEAIHLDGVSATEEEKSELESLLYSGVIL